MAPKVTKKAPTTQSGGTTKESTSRAKYTNSASSLFSSPKYPTTKASASFSSADLQNEANEQKLKQTEYAQKVFKSFEPYQWFTMILLRFPFQRRVTPTGFVFLYNAKSIPAIGFLFTSVVLGIAFFLLVINTIGSFLDFPRIQAVFNTSRPVITSNGSLKLTGDYRLEEEYIIRRNIIPLVILITSLCHITIGNWHLFKLRHFAASYFTFWTKAVELTSIDAAAGVRKYMKIILSCYGAFLLLFFLMCALRFAPVASGGPALLAVLTVRCFYPAIHVHQDFYIAREFGAGLFFFLIICSKIYMLLFIMICRFLRNAFLVWNRRLEQALFKGQMKDENESNVENGNEANMREKGSKTKQKKDFDENMIRSDYDSLFEDHVCLLDLLEGADKLFANIIESYYITQIISIISEIYYFYRSIGSEEEFKGARRLDGIIVLLYLIQSMTILIVVSLAAADIGEEEMEGLEILRKRGMMGDMEEEEVYFILSMYTSYTGFLDASLSGNGYFSLDKSFLVAVIGTIFSYFIILIQFTPHLLVTKDINTKVVKYDTQHLIRHVEGTHEYSKNFQVGYMQFVEPSQNASWENSYYAQLKAPLYTTPMWN